MGGIYYGFSIIGIIVIAMWFIRNDGRTETTGILAMKPLPKASREKEL